MLEFKGSWDHHLSMLEFAYNNSYQSSIQMSPYEALYGRKCRSSIRWFEFGNRQLLGPNIIKDAVSKLELIRDRIRATQSRQKSYADNKR